MFSQTKACMALIAGSSLVIASLGATPAFAASLYNAKPGQAVATSAALIAGSYSHYGAHWYYRSLSPYGKTKPPTRNDDANWMPYWVATKSIMGENTAARKAWLKSRGWRAKPTYYSYCSLTASLAIWLSGVDDNFPFKTPSEQESYCKNSPKWKYIGTQSRYDKKGVTLQPGDVLFRQKPYRNHHVMIFAGTKAVTARFTGQKQSSSNRINCPFVESAAGVAYPTATYRKVNRKWDKYLKAHEPDTRDRYTYAVYRPVSAPSGSNWTKVRASEKTAILNNL